MTSLVMVSWDESLLHQTTHRVFSAGIKRTISGYYSTFTGLVLFNSVQGKGSGEKPFRVTNPISKTIEILYLGDVASTCWFGPNAYLLVNTHILLTDRDHIQK